MRKLFGWIGLLAAIILGVVLSFTLYAHFLVDYSLDSLEVALSAAEKPKGELSSVSQNVYRNLLKDVALEEAVLDDKGLKNAALVELAARSFDEVQDRAGQARAKLYIGETLRTKDGDRSRILQILDRAHGHFQRLYHQVIRFVNYLQKRLSGEKEKVIDVASYLLVSQAEEKEQKWQLDDAADLYRRFLKFYPDHPDHPFVTLSLSQVLIKQKKYHEAERLLRGLTVSRTGMEEYQIAAGLLQKINEFRRRQNEIKNLEKEIAETSRITDKEALQLRLGLLQLSSYDLEAAHETFRSLERAEVLEVRQKAKFYLAWIYKIQAQYDQGAGLFLELNQQENLWGEAALGVNAQLADIYYQQNEIQKSLEFYAEISASSLTSEGEYAASLEAWAALADSEQATMYYFDLNNQTEADERLSRLDRQIAGFDRASDLKSAFERSTAIDLRDLAFLELRKGRIYEAFELFKKKVIIDPEDAWAHAGLATVYILMSDLKYAAEYAVKAYEDQPDAYTSAVLGYVRAYENRYDEAIGFYELSLSKERDYIPVIYNVAGVMLVKGRAQEALQLLQSLEGLFAHDARTPMKAKIFNNKGYALERLGKRDEARRNFERALELIPELPEARFNLNQLNQTSGRAALALSE